MMCNRRKISETITGPATDALDRSLKRPQTEMSTYDSHATFDFPELYKTLVAAIDGSDEAFPFISCSFDDASSNEFCSQTLLDHLHPTHFLIESTKEVSNSMQRSKSFRTNLSDMGERPTFFNQRSKFISNRSTSAHIWWRSLIFQSFQMLDREDFSKTSFRFQEKDKFSIQRVRSYSIELDILWE